MEQKKPTPAPTPVLVAYADDVRALLEEAIDRGFTEVLVVGLRDQEVHVKHSASLSRVRTLGYLEIARDRVLRDMQGE